MNFSFILEQAIKKKYKVLCKSWKEKDLYEKVIL